jgi:hypothetical protein
MLQSDPSPAAWEKARAKRLEWAGLSAELGPEESMASHALARAKTREGLFKLFGSLTDPEVEALVFDLDFWARRQQIPPSTPGKSALRSQGAGSARRTGARWAIRKAREGRTIGALIGPTAADVRDTMIRGSSGILALSPPWFMPVYEPSKRRVTWPNGVLRALLLGRQTRSTARPEHRLGVGRRARLVESTRWRRSIRSRSSTASVRRSTRRRRCSRARLGR